MGVLGIDLVDTQPDAALALMERTGATYPSLADPGGTLYDERGLDLGQGLPQFLLLDGDGRLAHRAAGGLDSLAEVVALVEDNLGGAAVTPGLPDWLRPVEAAARGITVHDLTRFMPPDEPDLRRGAVLMLFGEGEHGPDLLLTERNRTTCARTRARSRSRAARIDPGETAHDAALREAEEETGLDPSGVEVFAELPELYLPPSNFAVTPVLAWWREPSPVHVRSPGGGARRLPGAAAPSSPATSTGSRCDTRVGGSARAS